MRNVLILCTGNSARSIMAEACLGFAGKGRYRSFSAGSTPAGRVNPFAIEILQAEGIPLPDDLRSKSWDEFAGPDAPQMDIVITVCDNAAREINEVCPVWPGAPVSLHWPFPDPAAVSGSDEAKRAAFREVFQQIKAAVDDFVQGRSGADIADERAKAMS